MRAITRRGALALALAERGGDPGWLHPRDPIGAGSPAASASVSSPTVSSPAVSPTPTPTLPTATPTPTPTPTGPAVEVGRGPSTKAQVALTFHGAGDPALAHSLLTLLASRQVTVTVLAVGTWLAANPTIAAAVLAGGHEFGNHTWTHPTLSDLSEAAVATEIQRCRDLLVAQTGSPGSYFRQSADQHSTPLIRSVAGALGYRTCLSYDIDSLDWTDPSTATVRRAVAGATAGSVVSLHFGHQVTIDALPGILDDLTTRGLAPVTASRLLAA